MPSPDPRPSRRMLWTIFLAALAIRWIYSTALFALFGSGGVTGVDSGTYLAIAEEFFGAVRSGAMHGWQWLGPNPSVIPLFTWLIALNAPFGSLLPLSYVLMQSVLDAGTCVLIFMIAHSIYPRLGIPAAIAATINPTQIVLSGMVYPDTPFVFFVTLMFFALLRWLQVPSLRWAAVAGFALGAAALVRILIAPWIAALTVLLLIIRLFRGRLTIPQAGQIAIMAAIASLMVAPVVARNVTQFGAWALTAQTGTYMAGWIVPLTKEIRDRTPWQKTFDEMEARKQERFGPPDKNPFEESRRQTVIGLEEFRKFDVATLCKTWAFGAAINMASPAIILSPPILKLPRTGFYATPGSSALEKVGNFLFHSENALYTWILLVGIAGLAAVRLIQLVGVLNLMLERDHWPILLLFGAWIGFILAVNGPIASPKYRLPMEPLLNVLTAAGFCTIRRWRSERTTLRAPSLTAP